MDIDLLISARSVFKMLERTTLGEFTPDKAKEIFGTFGKDLSNEQAVAIASLAQGQDPVSSVQEFIMNGGLANVLLARHQLSTGNGDSTQQQATLQRCPHCNNLHM